METIVQNYIDFLEGKESPIKQYNLQFLTWFENRCKNDMNQEEWNLLKNNINQYFIWN